MFLKAIAGRVGGGVLRHVVGYAGAFLVARGWVDADTATVGTNYIADLVIGSVLGLGAGGWSVVNKVITPDAPEVNTPVKIAVQKTPDVYTPIVDNAFRLSGRSRNNLKGVDPLLVKVVETAIQLTSMDFGVTEGLRTAAEQQANLDADPPKSWVKRSKHQDGLAVDVIAYPTPKGSWEPRDYYPINDAFQEAAARCGARITWGGTWKQGDYCHIQLEGEIA